MTCKDRMPRHNQNQQPQQHTPQQAFRNLSIVDSKHVQQAEDILPRSHALLNLDGRAHEVRSSARHGKREEACRKKVDFISMEYGYGVHISKYVYPLKLHTSTSKKKSRRPQRHLKG